MMPISATGKGKYILPIVVRNHGFTLLEILVVLVVIATMAGLVMMNVGGNPTRDLQREAQRLQYLFQLATDEAVLQGRELGWLQQDNGYQFVMYDAENLQWQVIQEKPFKSHKLPEFIELTLDLEGGRGISSSADDRRNQNSQQIKATEQWLSNNEDSENKPQLLFLSSGESVPFRLIFSHQQYQDIALELASDGVNETWIN